LYFLKYIKYLVFISVISIFIGCGSKNYTYQPSYSYQKNFNIPANTKINSSKSMQRATMKPYRIGGKTYYPTTVSEGDTFSGIASWYGKDFHGKKTSNGEYYNMYDMTAAHKTLPMNTMVRVTNLRNSRSVVVRINDRGPFVSTRVIDLSYAAASRLGVIARGTAPVRLEVVGFKGLIRAGKTTPSRVKLSGFLVQIGAFRNKSGASRFASRYANVEQRYISKVKKYMLDGYPIYRVYLSGFGSENEARDFMSRGEFRGSFIVRN